MWLVSGGRAVFQLLNWLLCIYLRREAYCSLVTMINFDICIWISSGIQKFKGSNKHIPSLINIGIITEK